jgi:hypothetical protein
VSQQVGEPGRIVDVRLAPRDDFHMRRIGQQELEAVFQSLESPAAGASPRPRAARFRGEPPAPTFECLPEATTAS